MYSTIPDKKIIQQGKEYLMIYRGPGFLQSYDLAPPPTPSALFSRQQVVFAQSYWRERGRGGGGAKSYDREGAWSTINH